MPLYVSKNMYKYFSAIYRQKNNLHFQPFIASALNVSGVRKRSITPDMADISKELQRIETSTKSPASRRNSARRKTQTHDEESVGFDASHFKKRGSTYRGSFKAKGSNPYPTKRKGSFRRNDGE